MVNKRRINKRKRNELKIKRVFEGYLFASPWIIGFIVFTGGPIVASLILSFSRYDIVTPAEWVGITNYKYIFTDYLFWKSLYNTLYYVLFSIPLSIIAALAIALLLNQKLIGIKWFRTMCYVPAVSSGVAVSLLWIWLFDPHLGLINIALGKIGIRGPLWLQSEVWSKPALILMRVWGVGTIWVIYLAGLQGISKQLYEAAGIDGANWWTKFWHITLPMLSPAIFFTLIIGIIGSFQIFTQAYVMTDGGPRNSTLFYVFYLYLRGFRMLKMGTASSMAWVLFIIILVLTLIQFKLSSKWVYYETGPKR